MAKKVINVVYKVDDSALSKTKVTIQQVAAETKKSEQAMTSLSNTAVKTGNTIKSTYDQQRLQLELLRAKINQTDQADTQRLNSLKSQYLVVKKSVDDFNRSLTDTNKNAQNSVNVFGDLKSIIAATFSVAALKQLGSFVLEMNRLAGQVDGVTRAFNKLPNSKLIMEELKRATHGTVDELTLMQKALQAQNFGIPLEKLGDLLEFATTRAQQTGISVDYLVDSIVTGLGRNSIKILDNLQINIGELKKRVQETGQTTQQVAIQMIGESLQKMDKYVENSATKVAQLEAQWKELRIAVAEEIVDKGGKLNWIEMGIKGFTMWIQGAEKYQKKQNEILGAGPINEFIKRGNITVETVQAEIDRRTKNIEAIEKEMKAISARNDALIAEHNPATGDEQGRLKGVYNAQNDVLQVRKASLEILKQYQTQVKLTASVEQVQIGAIEGVKKKIDETNDAIEVASESALPKLNNQLRELQSELERLQNLGINKKQAGPLQGWQVAALLGFDPDLAVPKLTAMADFAKKSLTGMANTAESIRKESAEKQKEWDKDELKTLKEQEEEKLRLKKQAADYQKEVIRATQDFAIDSLQQTLYASLLNRQTDQQDLEAKYQAELDAAGNNEQAKKKIQKKIDMDRDQQRAIQAQKDKDDAITKIEIDTLIAIARTFAQYGYPAGIPFAALMAATGGIAIATIKSVKSSNLATRAFKDGEVDIDGPGTSTSDSISAKLSKGESVINADATKASRNLLEAINERKIDDRILHRLAGDGGRQAPIFDDTRIVKAINANKVNLAVEGNTLMEYRQVTSNFKRRVRAKVGV